MSGKSVLHNPLGSLGFWLTCTALSKAEKLDLCAPPSHRAKKVCIDVHVRVHGGWEAAGRDERSGAIG